MSVKRRVHNKKQPFRQSGNVISLKEEKMRQKGLK